MAGLTSPSTARFCGLELQSSGGHKHSPGRQSHRAPWVWPSLLPFDKTRRDCSLDARVPLSAQGHPLFPAPAIHAPHLSPEVDCGIPSEVKHAWALFNSTRMGSLAEYLCEPGYFLSPQNNPRICKAQGVWSDPPECNGNLVWDVVCAVRNRAYAA